MLHFLKRKHDLIEQNQITSETYNLDSIPSADEILERTKQNWPILSTQEIIEKIVEKSERGERDLWIFRIKVTDETIATLRAKNFHATYVKKEEIPYLKVSW